ncbi:MAG: glycosyltransferase [Francisellaceae bacterium]|jgi:glycosyltransferase involved in cell wall biosynthesis|nr:glycosyltransferase [Francisellaceae bacterium]MBT6207391.1 glycosyltransferase [Francisellaceae bacterium]MBT6539366.1 glycosyltransferase [Francisellaceae bacterium]
MSNNILNIIEPTLYNLAGHGYSYVSQVAKSASENGHTTHVWMDKRDPLLLKELAITTHPWFSRKFRQVQKIILYYQLIKKSQIIYICTSELWDIKILSFLTNWLDPQARIICHFHQFKVQTKKIRSLKKIAKSSPNISIFTPTERLKNIFSHSGFRKVYDVPCPSYPPPTIKSQTSKIEPTIIYAGAARADKGFPKIIDVIKLAHKINLDIKFHIQASKPNSNRYDEATQIAVDKLLSLSKNNRLQIIDQTLTQLQYQDLFYNSIALLLYDQSLYENKFSGVMLDAIYAHCPVITTKNTWMGDVTEKYGIGISISIQEQTPTKIINAIRLIKDNYQQYLQKTVIAAALLKQDHNPINTINTIEKAVNT